MADSSGLGHLRHRSVDEMIGCWPVERWIVAGVRCRGRNRKNWGECVDDDMKL